MGNLLAQAALFVWLPAVVFLFTSLPVRKALVSSYVIGWLALPDIGWSLPGLPDFTKMTATVASVVFCVAFFDQRKLFEFRPRWYDLPILAWCIGPFFSALFNDLGAYEGVSAVVSELERWGVPYLTGRIYLNDRESIRDLCLAVVIGGLCYLPFCLIEVRFSPIMGQLVYGITQWEGTRHGGYRPRVFLHHGLELGMWMTIASFFAYLLWSSGAVKTIRNVPFGILTIALFVTTLLCKSTGALVLLMLAMGIFWISKKSGKPWLVWLLLAVPPLYCVTRTFDLWSGQEVVEVSKSIFGGERAQSFEYRLSMERQLADRALERPGLGWGRWNRFQVKSKDGKTVTVPDGFWIICLGMQGTLGLVSMLGVMLLPLALTLRRFPVQTWGDPAVVPIVGQALILALLMVDFLSNAMLNPMYPLVAGGLLGQVAFRAGLVHVEAEEAMGSASEMVGAGRMAQAAQEFRRAIELTSHGDDLEGRTIQAKAFDGLGQTQLAIGRLADAEQSLREALLLRDWLATDSTDSDRFRDLAIAREGLARALAEGGRTAEAIGERGIALRVWEVLTTEHPKNADYKTHRANALNDLAWMLATDPDPRLLNPDRALSLAEDAIEATADHDAFWNTLGVARCRVGDWAGAIEALERSALSAPGGQGTAFDHYFLAMAWYQLHHDDVAREWLERGIAWASRHRPGHAALDRFRYEVESILAEVEPPRQLNGN